MANIVIINPKFDISFWGFEEALPFLLKRANLPVGALPLIAALTPSEHSVTLIDENVEPIDFAVCARADIVGLTGMSVQRHRMLEIARELKKRNCFLAIGGPWVSAKEDYFDGLADVIFVGEAEDSWPRFLKDWEAGASARRYEQAEKTDMTRVPVPRFDLLKMGRYAFASLQFSRGCPFQCEFCDIIIMFGRRPRIKTAEQILAELDALRRTGVPHAFVVDDNLIGNKKEIKKILRRVIAWQQENGFPMSFVTEASLDLADDPELMDLMVEANFTSLFVGIESTNEEALRETKKLQNIRSTGTLSEKVRRIQDAGLEVWAGMIVGFDNDREDVFENQRKFIESARINLTMIGMLTAIPTTPLYKRLAEAGRLDLSDTPSHGTNVLPLNMSREALSQGYIDVMSRLYERNAFFKRFDALWLEGPVDAESGWRRFALNRPIVRFRKHLRCWVETAALTASIAVQLRDPVLRRFYMRRIMNALRKRPDAIFLRTYVLRCMLHYHFHRLIQRLQATDRPLINTF